jgi:hypothetical protein
MDNNAASDVTAAVDVPRRLQPQPQSVPSSVKDRAVRRLLHAMRDGWLVEACLVETARVFAADAHRNGLRAEQMVVALKDMWNDLPEVRGAVQVVDVRQLLNELVTRCIRDFYDGSASDGSTRQGD